jgi:hypothetical protein
MGFFQQLGKVVRRVVKVAAPVLLPGGVGGWLNSALQRSANAKAQKPAWLTGDFGNTKPDGGNSTASPAQRESLGNVLDRMRKKRST